jgi:hypothetical protein
MLVKREETEGSKGGCQRKMAGKGKRRRRMPWNLFDQDLGMRGMDVLERGDCAFG